MNYEKHYFTRILNAVSQFLHALFGGSGDISMSARCGYEVKVGNARGYALAQKVVDWSFKSIDGENHCLNAYHKDPLENFDIKPIPILVVLTSVLGSILLKPILWIAGKVLNYTKK